MRPDRASGAFARFVLLTLAGAAVLHGALVGLGLPLSLRPSSPSLYLYLAGLATPSLAALLLSGSGQRRAFLRSTLAARGSLGAYATAIVAQAGILGLAWLLLLASGAPSRPSPSLAPGFLLLAAGQLWVVLGEELGWRGFALPRLELLLPPRGATLVLALVWGVWHTPMFFVADSLQAGASPGLFAASIFAWSAIHTALHHRARPSVLPNLLFHGCANITLSLGLVPGELEPYLLAAYLLVGVAVWAALRPPG